MTRGLAETVQINLNYAAWYYTSVHGGDAIQGWRYRDAGLPADLAVWPRGDFEGPDALPRLAIFVVSTVDSDPSLPAQLHYWESEGTSCWTVDPGAQTVCSGQQPAVPITTAELRVPALPGFRLDCSRLFAHQG